METTDRHGLPYVIAAQAQKHVTVNETFRALDALVQMSVRSATRTEEPAAPSGGEGYILPMGATGAAWDALGTDTVAVFQDGAWAAFAPRLGMTVYVEEEGVHRVWDGGAWTPLATGADGGSQDEAPVFGINASADAANRLTVKSDGVLHSHDDVTPGSGDVRHALNKANEAATASFLFQSGWSGRAEIGLTGTDDFAFKVSADGSTWRTALSIDRTTGAVSLPNTEADGVEATAGQAASTAKAFTDGLAARLLADGGVGGGNLARTMQVVLSTTSGKVQIASAAANNMVEVFDDGAAYAAGTVRERLFLGIGEVAVLTGLSVGAVLRSTGGLGGVSENVNAGSTNPLYLGPMPLGLEGFAAKQFFFYAFRESSAGSGRVFVCAGAVPATVELRSGDGARLVDSASLDAFGYAELNTDADAEFQIVADQPVFAGVGSRGDRYADLRLVPSLSTELIGHTRNAYVSALYPNTTVTWHRQSGQSGSFTVSPGAPVDLEAVSGSDATDYAEEGFVILRASGPISALSGADGQGYDATPYYPLSALGQRVAVPMGSKAANDVGTSGFALAGPHEGTARIYDAAGTLFATIALTRTRTVSAPEDQLSPCAGRLAGSAFPADFPGGYIDADVPIYVVQNADANEAVIASGIQTYGDEVALPGITPEDHRCEVRRDANGLLRRRVVAGDGTDAWVLC